MNNTDKNTLAILILTDLLNNQYIDKAIFSLAMQKISATNDNVCLLEKPVLKATA